MDKCESCKWYLSYEMCLYCINYDKFEGAENEKDYLEVIKENSSEQKRFKNKTNSE
jgi:hypothetical protein